MSKDIRSFFKPKTVQKPKLVENDDDVIPESPEIQVKKKKKEARKRRVLSDDSDEEIFSSKKNKSNETTKTSHTKTKTKSPQKPKLKEVNAVDIFGDSRIKRTEPLVIKSKKNTEIGIHLDDEFDKSLLELDGVDVLEDVTKLKSPSKINGDAHKSKATLINNNDTEKKSITDQSTSELKKSTTIKISNKRSFDESIGSENKIKDDKDNKNKNSVDSIKKWQKKKDDFSEFIGDVSTVKDHAESESNNKKRKLNKSLNESVLTDEERHERRMHSTALYQQYKNRPGPKNLGAKEMPEGTKDCFKDCAFLLTGVLDSFEREEITSAITKFGGCVKNSMSKKVTHVLAGEDAGPAKMAKAHELGIKIINEDEFLQMIIDLSKSETSNNHKAIAKKENTKKETTKKDHSRKLTKDTSPSKERRNKEKSVKKDIKQTKNTPEKAIKKEPCETPNQLKIEDVNSEIESNHVVVKRNHKANSETKFSEPNIKTEIPRPKSENLTSVSSMWVERYKPQNLKQIIGQHGDASNVKKLSNWLTKWYVNRKAKLPKPSPWAKNDDGGFFKAALLSGPPGVGKTTTVALVCKELGFDAVEFNASDTRSKNLIKEQIGEMLTTTSLSAFAKGDNGKQAVSKKHVLVMDEVDGMAGNEDRGGMQELIGLIKSTAVPIICMCNDRNSQKMKSLLNYVYELKFSRPRIDQIKSAMMSICFKEGLKIPADILTQLITAANRDVRQTLNLLSMWSVDPDLASPGKLVDAKKIKTDLKLGPWEAVHKVFTQEEHKNMSINEKSDLFFYDYSLAPLFVQENYLSVEPHCPKKEILQRISKAADSISMGDLVEARIRSRQAWGLLPVQAMYSSVIPGHEMSGHVTKFIQFPGWLGKNSRANKMHRLCQEIHAHTRLSTSGSKSSIFLDYCSHLRDAIVNPLIKDKTDGIPKSIEVLESYHLLRDDLDSLTELSLWPTQRNPMILVDSKVKAAMTRTYNKSASALPYAPGAVKRGRGRQADADAGPDAEAELDDDDDQGDDSDPELDALIKKKKSKESEKPGSSKEKPGSSKEKPSSSKEKQKTCKEKGKKK